MAQLIDGKAIAAGIREQAKVGVAALRSAGRSVKLVSVLVGDPEAAGIYAQSQARCCAEVGIEFELRSLPASSTLPEIKAAIGQLNQDPTINGIMLNLPLPAGLNESEVQYCIDPYKDVEGVNPANIGFVFYGRPIIAPCTALSVLEILKHLGQTFEGRDVVIVGQGAIVGRPITLFLLQEMATVTACHKATRDLARHTAQADVLIVAVGKPGLITGDMVKKGAVVIDIGINRIKAPSGDMRIVGDVDSDSVGRVASVLTPVPGGVGPVTVSILLRNTVEAAQEQVACGHP
jgi:methylenetetrahydrofolate dehydrogenase (NADP+)/methenyltetrahydrofolate cyclohydrolase